MKKNQPISIFHRYSQDPNGYFMAYNNALGSLHPSIGKTDGWTTGIVTEDWQEQNYDPNIYETWVEIKWTHELWYDRCGNKLNTADPKMITQRVKPEQIALKTYDAYKPQMSFLFVRWGGAYKVDPVTEGDGGWGKIGATCSDEYINAFEQVMFKQLGPNYEIISIFIQNSEDLTMLTTPLLRELLTGEKIGACYFLWPIGFEDGHNYPGYVEKDKYFSHMFANESAGIQTLFPHCTHLYNFFASKNWLSQQCLSPELAVPLTVKVPRSTIANNPLAATKSALKALNYLNKIKYNINNNINNNNIDININKGVVKLGWSWEARDVKKWQTESQLTTALQSLTEQPGSKTESAFVQEWVDFDIEMRHYVIAPDINNPASMRPKKIVFTKFTEETENGFFTSLSRLSSEQVISDIFQNNLESFNLSKQQCEKLIIKWINVFIAECSELPTMVRFDFPVKYLGPGQIRVYTGEITEMGACFLGWEEGPDIVFKAIIDSCLGNTENI